MKIRNLPQHFTSASTSFHHTLTFRLSIYSDTRDEKLTKLKKIDGDRAKFRSITFAHSDVCHKNKMKEASHLFQGIHRGSHRFRHYDRVDGQIRICLR